jgi:transcription antitermination factor NusG
MPSEYPWFAVRVKSRCEKMVSELFRQRGYEEFLPVYRSRRKWSDRIKVVELPLFTGYLFCRFDPNKRASILSTPGVFLIVGQGRTPVPIDSTEVEGIRVALASGQRVQPWPNLVVGQTVRIEMGAVSGVEGTLLRFKGSNHLIIGIQLLQRSVAVEIDESWVMSSKPTNSTPSELHPSSKSYDNLRQLKTTPFNPIFSS